jgi:hypothetical protein
MARGEIKALVLASGVTVTAATAAPSTRARYTQSWNGTDYQKTEADVSIFTDDAKTCIWELQDVSGNNYGQMQGCVIDFPTSTSVRVTFGEDFPPASGTYYLVGS